VLQSGVDVTVGFIGANQVNVFLLRKWTSEQIFRATLIVECPVILLFLAGTYFGWLGLPGTLRDVGVKADQLDQIAEESMHDRWVHTNPRRIAAVDAAKSLQSPYFEAATVWSGRGTKPPSMGRQSPM